MHRVAVFMGTRPEAIKMAPVIRALDQAEGLSPLVVSTGQHREMSEAVNPYGDGKAAGRIVDALQRYLADD